MIIAKTKKNKIYHFWLIAVFFFISAFFSQSADSEDFRSEKIILDNGLTVLISELPTSPVVCVYGLVKTGSAREGRFIGSGISHYLEHMLFKGTHGRGVGEVAARIQAVGGSMNGSTGLDFTIYTINLPAEHLDLALDVLSDMLFEATIDPEEVEREREVIYAEMRMHNDNPDRRISRLAFANIYQKHPYRHPIIGYPDLLAKITREDLWQYYQQRYAPNNMVLSIAGNVRPETVQEKIKKKFEHLPRGPYVLDVVPDEPVQQSERRYEEAYPTEFARLSLGFKSVSLLEKDLYPLDVLAQILGKGQSSRLYQELFKDKGLVYSINASNYTPVDTGVFEIEALLEYKNVAEVEKEVFRLIKQVQSKGVTEKELRKAKRQVLSGYVKGNLRAASVAWHQALDEAFAGDHQFSKKYVAKVNEVSVSDIKRVANEYLTSRQLTVTLLKPKTAQKETFKERSFYQGNITKHVFDNGLTVLLRKDPSFPHVSIRLALKGGLLTEPESLNGLVQLMAGVWIEGSKRLSSKDIQGQTEARGIELSSYAGRNSFGIGMSLLSDDIDFALDILEQIITEPTFPEKEITRFKENMLSVIKERDNNIFPFTGYTLKQELFAAHPYARETTGTEETVVRIQRDDLIQYHQNYVAPNNMVLSVFGDIEPQAVLTTIQKRLGKLPRKEVLFKKHPLNEIKKSKEVIQTLNKEQAIVTIGFLGVDIFDKDRYGLEVLESILGSAFNGRLFNSVREKLGQAYTMGGVSLPGLDRGQVSFYVLTEKAALPTVRQILESEIQKLRSIPVPEDELSDIKTYLKGNFKAGLELNDSLAFMSGLDELYGLGFDTYQSYADNIDQVTQKDIQRLAQKYLDLNRAVTVITQPE